MDGLLRQRRAQRAGDGHQGNLSPQQPDPARLRAAAAARRDRPLPRAHPLGDRAREHRRRPACPTSTAVWAHEIGAARLLLGVAIRQRYPGHAKQAGHVAAMCHCRRLCRALRDRGRRRHRRVQPGRADVGDADALRSRNLDRHHHATPGRRRSIRASSPSARPRAISPTAAPSSTPAGPGIGATSSPRSTRRRPKRRGWPGRSSAIC